MRAAVTSADIRAAIPAGIRTRSIKKPGLLQNVQQHPMMYLMVLPGLLFFVLIRIVPSLGLVIAFQNYSIFQGFFASEWVGFENFRRLFSSADFYRVIRNTMFIGLGKVAFGFAPPIVLALLMSEVRNKTFSNTVQMAVFLPRFLSWVIVSQIFINILHPSSGVVNILLTSVFGADPVFFMARPAFFQPIVIISGIWKEAGYESIVYMAAIASIDPQLFEAARIDGAGRWRQTWNITLPSISTTIIVMLLLKIGRFLEVGFDHVWTLINPVVYSTGDIINTYVYRVGILQGKYSLTTAMDIFKALIGLSLILAANWVAKRITGKGYV